MVDIAPIRVHLAGLRAAGMRLIDIAEQADISVGWLNKICYTKNQRTLNPTTAAILLSLTPQPGRAALIDATGTHRRLQALAAAGWSWRELATRLGTSPSLPGKLLEHTRVHHATAQRIDALYTDLAHRSGPSAITASRAQTKGWLPPKWWISDDIDDPDTNPLADPDPNHVDVELVDRVLHRSAPAHLLTPAERGAAARLGCSRGLSIRAVAVLLGTRTTVINRLVAAAA